MSDKERLNKINSEYQSFVIGNSEGSWEFVSMEDAVSLDDIGWLIEQVEQLNELKENHNVLDVNEICKRENKRLHEENKRYYKALEFYAHKPNYYKLGSNSTVSYDDGVRARKALEGLE